MSQNRSVEDIPELKPHVVVGKGIEGLILGASGFTLGTFIIATLHHNGIQWWPAIYNPYVAGLITAVVVGGVRAFRNWWKHR